MAIDCQEKKLDKWEYLIYHPIMVKERLIHKMNMDLRKLSMPTLAEKIGMEYTTLRRILNGERGGRMDTWENIIRYYDRNGR